MWYETWSFIWLLPGFTLRNMWEFIQHLECIIILVAYHLAKIGHMVYENSSNIYLILVAYHIAKIANMAFEDSSEICMILVAYQLAKLAHIACEDSPDICFILVASTSTN